MSFCWLFRVGNNVFISKLHSTKNKKKQIKICLTLIFKRAKPVEWADQPTWHKATSSKSALICTVLSPRWVQLFLVIIHNLILFGFLKFQTFSHIWIINNIYLSATNTPQNKIFFTLCQRHQPFQDIA